MKISRKSFAGALRLYQGGLMALLLVGLVVQSSATIYTINSVVNGNTYAASYDSSANGFTAWSVNGANQLALQSLYYSINGGPAGLLTGAAVITGSSGFSGKYITATYSTSAGSIADTLTINGSVLNESIQFNNLTANPLNVSIFQYSDFVLGGPSAAGSQTVNLTPASGGGYATAKQSGGGLTLTWNGDAPSGATRVQANSSGSPFGAFIGLGSDLDNTTLAAINTFAVFGYEFSGNVLSGNLLSISENAAFPSPVPEPVSVALISAGTLSLVLSARRRRS